MKKTATVLVSLLACFMVATLAIAIWQPSGWGPWWMVPLGFGFVTLIVGFRVLLQRAEDRTRRLDAELDRLENS
ncbi:hypothetical protein ACQB6R_03175 [Propionibacteriaceae bacterium G1746]|uniref:hypothetical protein n=1 Tax=Aestuariimicrobium sp. G57 TaxID=3418485 RepID=UPI003C188BC8